tara:strand:- start:1476 stop:1757 length:282 start_codon:yes stop_codon:yes gene_type:complete
MKDMTRQRTLLEQELKERASQLYDWIDSLADGASHDSEEESERMYAEMRSLAGSVKAMVDLLHAESWQEVQEEYPVSPLRGVDFPAHEGVDVE